MKKVVSVQRLPIRGGNWNNGSNAGVFYLNLNNGRTNANNNLGSRLALIDCGNLILKRLRVCKRTKGDIDPAEKLTAKLYVALMRLVTLIKDNIVMEIQS